MIVPVSAGNQIMRRQLDIAGKSPGCVNHPGKQGNLSIEMRTADEMAEERLRRLISHLPERVGRLIHRLRRPEARWARLPMGLLFLLGGVFSFLPVLGIWMLPIGLLLLGEDVPPLRRLVYRSVNWLARRKPAWFT